MVAPAGGMIAGRRPAARARPALLQGRQRTCGIHSQLFGAV